MLCSFFTLLDQKKGKEPIREGGAPRTRRRRITTVRCHMQNLIQRAKSATLGSHFPKAMSQKVLTIFRFEKPYLVHSWLCHVKFQDSVLDSCILPCVFRPSSFHNPWHPFIVSFLPRAKILEHVLCEDHSLSNLLQGIGEQYTKLWSAGTFI